VTGTTVNGINDQGYMVGFYSNGTTGVKGFLAAPEPSSSLALIGLAGLALGRFWRRKRRNAWSVFDNGSARASQTTRVKISI
jgi:MYXO-CTERM domain-containing protein